MEEKYLTESDSPINYYLTYLKEKYDFEKFHFVELFIFFNDYISYGRGDDKEYSSSYSIDKHSFIEVTSSLFSILRKNVDNNNTLSYQIEDEESDKKILKEIYNNLKSENENNINGYKPSKCVYIENLVNFLKFLTTRNLSEENLFKILDKSDKGYVNEDSINELLLPIIDFINQILQNFSSLNLSYNKLNPHSLEEKRTELIKKLFKNNSSKKKFDEKSLFKIIRYDPYLFNLILFFFDQAEEIINTLTHQNINDEKSGEKEESNSIEMINLMNAEMSSGQSEEDEENSPNNSHHITQHICNDTVIKNSINSIRQEQEENQNEYLNTNTCEDKEELNLRQCENESDDNDENQENEENDNHYNQHQNKNSGNTQMDIGEDTLGNIKKLRFLSSGNNSGKTISNAVHASNMSHRELHVNNTFSNSQSNLPTNYLDANYVPTIYFVDKSPSVKNYSESKENILSNQLKKINSINSKKSRQSKDNDTEYTPYEPRRISFAESKNSKRSKISRASERSQDKENVSCRSRHNSKPTSDEKLKKGKSLENLNFTNTNIRNSSNERSYQMENIREEKIWKFNDFVDHQKLNLIEELKIHSCKGNRKNINFI
jgi:hypothetical protein